MDIQSTIEMAKSGWAVIIDYETLIQEEAQEWLKELGEEEIEGIDKSKLQKIANTEDPRRKLFQVGKHVYTDRMEDMVITKVEMPYIWLKFDALVRAGIDRPAQKVLYTAITRNPF